MHLPVSIFDGYFFFGYCPISFVNFHVDFDKFSLLTLHLAATNHNDISWVFGMLLMADTFLGSGLSPLFVSK